MISYYARGFAAQQSARDARDTFTRAQMRAPGPFRNFTVSPSSG